MALTVTLVFETVYAKRKLMRAICDSIGESIDMRLEWHPQYAFDNAHVYDVRPGAIAEEQDNSFDAFDAGIFDESPIIDLIKERR